MSKKRSDALQALIAELVDAEQTVALLEAAEEEARQESVAARQALDAAATRTREAVGRRRATSDALGIIQARDAVSDETVDALRARVQR